MLISHQPFGISWPDKPSRRVIVYTQTKHSFGDGETENMSAGKYVRDKYIRYLHSILKALFVASELNSDTFVIT